MVTFQTNGMLNASEAGAIILDFSNCSWFGDPDVVVTGVFSDFNHDASDAPSYQVCVGNWFYDGGEASGQWGDELQINNSNSPPTLEWYPDNDKPVNEVDFGGIALFDSINAILFFAPGGIGDHGFSIQLEGIPGDDISGAQVFVTDTKSLASVTTPNGVPDYANFGDAPPASCFWTDLVGTSQQCDGGPPPEMTHVSVENNHCRPDEGGIDPIPDGFIVGDDFSIEVVDGESTFSFFTWNAELEEYSQSGSATDGVGIMSQGANTWPVEVHYSFS